MSGKYAFVLEESKKSSEMGSQRMSESKRMSSFASLYSAKSGRSKDNKSLNLDKRRSIISESSEKNNPNSF